MTLIGLTGGIAAGKSSVAALLRALGATIIDADQLARTVVAPGTPGLADVIAHFGPNMLLPDGTLDRQALGAAIFADADARAALNAILHPRIATASAEAIATAAAAGVTLIFYEAPLLFENGIDKGCDATVVVTVSPEVQLERLRARDGLSHAAAAARIASQMPLAEKVARATWVIQNDGDAPALAAQVAAVVAAITTKYGPIAAKCHDAPPALPA